METISSVPLSQQIIQRLKEKELPTKSQKAINNLVATCDFLQQQGMDICVATVGKICMGKSGGPATQSIRNNRDFREYVNARRTEQVLLPGRNRREAGGPFRTGDVNIDAHIQTLEYELAKVKSELRDLRRVLPRLGEYDLTEALEKGHLVICPPVIESLSAQAKNAIVRLLDRKVLSSVGLERVKTGQIISPEQNDAVLLSKLEVDALAAAAGCALQPALTG